MRAKSISNIIYRKINDWVSNIKDESLKTLIKRDVIVTGGCITSMLLDEKVNDFDVYFKTKETTKAVAEYYVKEFERLNENSGQTIALIDYDDRISIKVQSSGLATDKSDQDEYQYFEAVDDDDASDTYLNNVVPEMEDVLENEEAKAQAVGNEKYRPVFLSSNAITLSDRIQVIIRFYGDVKTIHENYDFVHCTNSWYLKEENWPKLNLRKDALESTLSKELRYVGSKYPVASVMRIRKFIKRGWYINAGQVFKILFQISELNLSDFKTLEDQLTGVDAAYFHEVLGIIKKKNGEDVPVERSYLLQLIERVF